MNDEVRELVSKEQLRNFVQSLLVRLDGLGAFDLEDGLFAISEDEQEVGGVRLASVKFEPEWLMLYALDRRREDRAQHELLFQSALVLDRLGLKPAAVHHSDIALRRSRNDGTRGRTERRGGHTFVQNGAGRPNDGRRNTLDAPATQTDTLPRVSQPR